MPSPPDGTGDGSAATAPHTSTADADDLDGMTGAASTSVSCIYGYDSDGNPTFAVGGQ